VGQLRAGGEFTDGGTNIVDALRLSVAHTSTSLGEWKLCSSVRRWGTR
jgi:hypothetical protein